MTTVNTQTTPATGIVFSLTTATDLGDIVTVHQAVLSAGFVRNTNGMVLLADDTDAVLATLRYVGSRSAGASIRHIDVSLGTAVEVGMGGLLVATLEALRDDLDCVICNPDGVPMDVVGLQAAADAIDASAVQRIEARRPKPVRLSDGNMRLPGALSFTHTTTTPRGRWLDECHFDAQPMSWHEGRREGMRRAGELLARIKESGGHQVQTGRTIAAAFGTTLASGTYSTSSTDNVSIGFINAIVAMLEGAAQHLDHAGYIERAIEDSRDHEKLTVQWDLERNKKTAHKAAASRAARRAAEVAA